MKNYRATIIFHTGMEQGCLIIETKWKIHYCYEASLFQRRFLVNRHRRGA